MKKVTKIFLITITKKFLSTNNSKNKNIKTQKIKK